MSMANALVSFLSASTTLFTTQANKVAALFAAVKAHVLDTENPHRVDKFDVGLSKVPNHAQASPEQAAAGKNNNTLMSPRRTDDYMAASVYDPLNTFMDTQIADLDS